ncbi:MAG: Hpt domain-containing protein [Caulobacteraceae bacterium]|nr:Hpt domain-containing protein [Caulobacter sp.]
MSALAAAPEGLRDLVDSVGLEPLKPLLLELDGELAGFVTAPPTEAEVLARQAHGLIGAAGGIGFTELAEHCRLLERACKAGGDVRATLVAAQTSAKGARGVIGDLAAA